MGVPLLAAIGEQVAAGVAREVADHAARDAARMAADVVRRAGLEALRDVELKATADLDLSRFEHLKKGVKVAVIRAANRSAKPLRAAVESHAASIARYSFLRKSIGTKTRIYPSGGIATVVGPKMSFVRNRTKYKRGPHKGQARRHRPYLYAWLLERGTKRSRRRPFVRPALDQLGHTYQETLAREVEAELVKLMG